MMLTGKFAFRRTLTGKVILRVEEEVKVRWPLSRKRPTRLRWRDARIIDLTETALQALMDLRNGSTFVPQSAYGAALASVIRTRQGTSPAEATRAGEAPRASGPLTAM